MLLFPTRRRRTPRAAHDRTGQGLLLAVLIATLLPACGLAGESSRGVDGAPPADAFAVLFVGNSLTYTNDLPQVVADLGAATDHPVYTRMVARPNYSLEEHWNEGLVHDVLAQGGWDVVVLQQGPSTLPANQTHLREWAGRFAGLARDRGVEPALYMVWPAAGGSLEGAIASYTAAAEATGATLLPAGRAWQEAWARAPSLPLYGSDQFHPSRLGTTLAALTILGGLTGDLPTTLPTTLDVGGRPLALNAETAEVLHDAAAAALATVVVP